MPSSPVILIDTSVLTNLLRVPGMSDQAETLIEEFEQLRAAGAKFVLPATTVIETGNHVAQCAGDRRGAAERFQAAVLAAQEASPPWTIREVTWGSEFLSSLLAGDSTGADMVDHLTNQTLGAGDIAILVERDSFRRETAFTDVRIWTLDAKLSAFN